MRAARSPTRRLPNADAVVTPNNAQCQRALAIHKPCELLARHPRVSQQTSERPRSQFPMSGYGQFCPESARYDYVAPAEMVQVGSQSDAWL